MLLEQMLKYWEFLPLSFLPYFWGMNSPTQACRSLDFNSDFSTFNFCNRQTTAFIEYMF
jgi:hypothetical protein